MIRIRIEDVEIDSLDLTLRSTFRTNTKTIREHRTLLYRIRAGGVWGEGEAYTMRFDEDRDLLQQLPLRGRTPWLMDDILGDIPSAPARSAVDIALHDLLGKLTGLPVCHLLGLALENRSTCVSIGVDEPSAMLDAARRWLAAGFHILKIKVASDTDPDIIHEIRMAGGEEVRIWVDANQGLDPESLVRLAPILQRDSVELIEQPFPIGRYEEYARVRPLLGIPIFLDEEVRSSEDVALAACAGGIDGVNVKMAKMGGIREALRAIHVARAHGLQVLLGCFFESSLGISASAHLQALADRIDLDSPLHLEADPYTGLVLAGATVAPTQTPGLGVMRAG